MGFDKLHSIGETDSVKAYQPFDRFMADKTPEQEPSIEEILASIRQIISDDEDKDSVSAAPVEDAPAFEPAEPVFEPVKAAAPAIEEPVLEEEEEEILELDTPLPPEPEEQGFEIDLQDREADHVPEPEPELAAVASPPPVQTQTDIKMDDILTETAKHATIASMAKLAGNMPVTRHREYGNITLEDLVREMLHPMLKDWVSENLPNMVERLVQKELEKLARQAQDV